MKGKKEYHRKKEFVWDLKGLEWRREQFKGLIEKKWNDCDEDVKRALKRNKHIPNYWVFFWKKIDNQHHRN